MGGHDLLEIMIGLQFKELEDVVAVLDVFADSGLAFLEIVQALVHGFKAFVDTLKLFIHLFR